MLGKGLGYDFSDKLYGQINYSYWFKKGLRPGKDACGRDISNPAGDAQSVGLTPSYRITPALLVNLGTTFTDFCWNDMDAYYEAGLGSYEVLYTDNRHIGCGIACNLAKDVTLNLSLARTLWENANPTNSQLPGVTIKTEEETTAIAVGFNMGF
jgi:hypothetical protein